MTSSLSYCLSSKALICPLQYRTRFADNKGCCIDAYREIWEIQAFRQLYIFEKNPEKICLTDPRHFAKLANGLYLKKDALLLTPAKTHAVDAWLTKYPVLRKRVFVVLNIHCTATYTPQDASATFLPDFW